MDRMKHVLWFTCGQGDYTASTYTEHHRDEILQTL
jgi:hypothetical protein